MQTASQSPSRTALQMTTADITAEESSSHQADERGHTPGSCNHTAEDHTISYKYSKVWNNDQWVQQSGVNLNRWTAIGKEINGSRKESL